eukprot:361988-Chlamydomonas_euryale.AAC.8
MGTAITLRNTPARRPPESLAHLNKEAFLMPKQRWSCTIGFQGGSQPSPRRDTLSGWLTTDKVPSGGSENHDDGWHNQCQWAMLHMRQRHSR